MGSTRTTAAPAPEQRPRSALEPFTEIRKLKPRTLAALHPDQREMLMVTAALTVLMIVAAAWSAIEPRADLHAAATSPVSAPPPATQADVSAPAAPVAAAERRSGFEVPSAARAAAQVSEGQILVTSAPSGAAVSINGVGWGHTPVTIRHLPLGTKNLRVTHDGYQAQQRTVQLSAGQPAIRVRLVLRQRPQ